jgi:hypothetical protein
VQTTLNPNPSLLPLLPLVPSVQFFFAFCVLIKKQERPNLLIWPSWVLPDARIQPKEILVAPFCGESLLLYRAAFVLH